MYLVFDIGATHTRIAVSEGENIDNVEIIPTPQNFEEAIKTLQETATKLTQDQEILGVAGGVPGPLDEMRNTVVNFPNLKDWNNKPLKDALKQAFNAPVYLENDAAIAALGESLHGAGKDKTVVGYLTIGTGVGGARIVDGKIDANSQGFELGHQIIDLEGKDCGCGGKGHLESYISGTAIKNIYGKSADEITDAATWDEICKLIAVGVNNLIVHWSPNIVVLGGGVSKSLPIDKVNKYLKEILTIYPQVPAVMQSKLQDKAGLYGALSLITNH